MFVRARKCGLFLSVSDKIVSAFITPPLRATMLHLSNFPIFYQFNKNYSVRITNCKALLYTICFHSPIRLLCYSLMQNVRLKPELIHSTYKATHRGTQRDSFYGVEPRLKRRGPFYGVEPRLKGRGFILRRRTSP